MTSAAFVFLGGGLGAVARYSLDSGLKRISPIREFPIGILVCNLLGCFLIGIALGYLSRSAPAWFSPLVITGFLGSFTTFSTFSRDTLHLFDTGLAGMAIANILLSVIPGLLAVWAGLKVT